MGQVILVTGGARSGKSRFAQQLSEDLSTKRVFVATCPPLDEEMQARIRRHRQERAGRGWETVEEPVALARVLQDRRDDAVVLVDCLTLWVNNLMYEAERQGHEVEEAIVSQQCRAVLQAGKRRMGPVVFVTNEVGMGIVPENALARKYRDLVGRCNQVIAAGADRVVLMVSGLPLDVK